MVWSVVLALHAPDARFKPTRPRGQPVVALIHETIGSFSMAVASVDVLPPGFEGFTLQASQQGSQQALRASSPHRTAFLSLRSPLAVPDFLSTESIEDYISMVLACSALASPTNQGPPAGSESDQIEPSYLPDGRIVSFESSFGWHNIDLRTPLPSLTELSRAEHPIGYQGGKRMYLCTARMAVKYGVVETSRVFSEHYGASVFICHHA